MTAGRQITVFDGLGHAFELDEDLRVVTGLGEGYIDYSCQTRPGQFGVWYPQHTKGFITTTAEIQVSTDAARSWIDGFLASSGS